MISENKGLNSHAQYYQEQQEEKRLHDRTFLPSLKIQGLNAAGQQRDSKTARGKAAGGVCRQL